MRMARVNVYLPDDLAAEVRASGLNVSQVTQEALRAALGPMRMDYEQNVALLDYARQCVR